LCILEGEVISMDAYKFDIRIKADGSIQLPYLLDLVDREAEIFIVPKDQKSNKPRKESRGKTFVKNWSGFISKADVSQSRIEFIEEKYKES
jgi:hypothetical protein